MKPCPLCGAEEATTKRMSNRYGEADYYAVCTTCGASSGVTGSRAEAVTLWNTRHPTNDPCDTLLDQMAEALEAVHRALGYYHREMRACDYSDERRSVRIHTINLVQKAMGGGVLAAYRTHKETRHDRR